MEREHKKVTISHELGAGAPCLKCKEKCEGFDLHFWRKICRNCKCGLEEHDIQTEEEAQRKVGRLFEDSRYAGVADRIRSDMETRLLDQQQQQLPRGAGGHYHRIVLDDRPPSAQLSFSSLSIGSSSSTSSNLDSGFDSASLASSASGSAMPGSAGPGPGDGKASSAPAAGGDTGSGRAPGSAPGAATGSGFFKTSAFAPEGGSPGGPGSARLSGSSTAPAPAAPGAPSRVSGGGSGVTGTLVPGGDAPSVVVLEWAPPGLERAVARRYIELLPREKQPIEGSQGAMYRRRQLARQLPEHDQNPSRCHDLSAAEVKQMEEFVKKYKAEALGVGDVLLPHQVQLIQGGGGIGAGGGFTHAMGPGVTGGGGGGGGGQRSTPSVGDAGEGAAGSPSRKRVTASLFIEGRKPGAGAADQSHAQGEGASGQSGAGGVRGGQPWGGGGGGSWSQGGGASQRGGPGGPGSRVGGALGGATGGADGAGGPGGPGAGGPRGGAGDGFAGGAAGGGAGGGYGGGYGGASGAAGGIGAVAGGGGSGAGGGAGWVGGSAAYSQAAGEASAGSRGVGDGAAQAQKDYRCNRCKQPMQQGDPAVFAERAGLEHLWHPGCFCCSACDEILVDLVYFWKRGKLYCGRHYCDTERPRCGGCDELIFSKEYTQAEEQNWHLKHFCCFECDCVLAGEIYVMEQDKPVCKPCYMKKYARSCQSCQGSIEPEAQRVTLGEFSWHAEPACFLCSCCGIPLVGLRFLPHQAMIFCSAGCRGKVVD